MRSLHVLAAFPRSREDVIVPWLVELLQRLRAEGVECEVFTSTYRGGGNSEYDGIPVHRFRYFLRRYEDLTHDEAAPDRTRRSLLYRILPVFYMLGGSIGIWRLCRRRQYDVIHVHWPFPHAWFGWVARWAGGGVLVTTFYGAELRWVKGSMPFFRWFIARAARSSAQVVAISSYTARELREIVQVPIEVIPYTIALPPSNQARATRRSGRLHLLFVGRLVERKGIQHLIEAVAALPERVGARLDVVGYGPELPQLESLAARLGVSGRVTFRGRVSQEQLQRAYADADVFVLPSVQDRRGDTEGLGVVLLEAMNERLPVVASDIGGITDIVRDGETGLLVPPGDSASLAAALLRLADDTRLASRLADRGFEHLHSHFSWDSIVQHWLAIYRRVIQRPAAEAITRQPAAER
jgi:glycosyltransferase involved in cell wall biosynthesis